MERPLRPCWPPYGKMETSCAVGLRDVISSGAAPAPMRRTGGTAPMSERPSLHTLVVIPTYNELENLPIILDRLQQARPDVHVLVVDDGSPDGTGKLADERAAAG